MNRFTLSGLLLALATSTFLTVAPALADDFGDEGQYQLAQSRFETIIDDRGRRLLIDPSTGEVVRIIRPGREKWRRDRARRNDWRDRRQAKRERRLRRLERELDALLDIEPEYRREDDFLRDRPRRERGFYLDELDEFDRPPKRRKRSRDRVVRKPLPRVDRNTKLARLPDENRDEYVDEKPQNKDWVKAKPKVSRETIAKLQIFLDREGFSPGVIDGSWGENVSKAMVSWQEARGKRVDLSNPLILDKYVNGSGFHGFESYRISSADINQPYLAHVPRDYADKAELQNLSYTSALEMLAERFHMSEGYLRRLNPNASFTRVGENIKVVRTGSLVTKKVHYIVADKSREQVRAYGRNGDLVAAYPATIGSAATPSPSGKVEVARIALDPNYTYNPKKNFQQGTNNKVLTIPPGPNGPVGSVWIALSKPTYGIHGTPNPSTIGKTNSHGCIRLTNWDAKELAALVSKGVTVEFTE